MTRNPWADYWATRQPTGQSGCLPQGAAATIAVLEKVWLKFAAALPASGTVLDLATGDGAVLRKLASIQPKLRLTGIDSSPFLPPAPPGICLRANVPMEALPFSNARFDAVTSQFGIEYGDTSRIAVEVARVLKPRGQACFVVHHSESVVLSHNLGRRQALAWASGESLMLDRARQLAGSGALAQLGIPTAFIEAVDDARRLHPNQSVAAEFTAAIAQTLGSSRHLPTSETLARLSSLEERARDEIGRIDALARAVCDKATAEAIADQFRGAGISFEEPLVLMEAEERPLAWLLKGRA